MTTLQRCDWVSDDPLYIAYHDEQWGVPCRDSQKLFEMLCLEGQQAGLSWITVLKKRTDYQRCFHHFDPVKVAHMTEHDIDLIMQDGRVIRHRGKLNAIVKNARAYLAMEAAGENFSDWIWAFVNHVPQYNRWKTLADVPSQTETSTAMARALKKRGFSFTGPTICYAFMQACGLVNDHLTTCHCHPEQTR